MFRPVLRLKVLSIGTRAKLLKTFVEPVLLYGLPTIIHLKVNDIRLKAVQNTTRRMMLGLYSRRQMSVEVMAEKVPLRNLAAQI
ncbi:unnamed protein product [Hymenolepis diminuta]|uniref:Uncharacterized protein n=1 Tax=Hymenolepis diminuta TaxID=6216 RepID=A0A564Y0K2_HYMDI|nr:unnamed protein product [Hymenolepis diminuta]